MCRGVRSLGYVEGSYDPDYQRSGVIEYDRDRAFNGYNFYNSRKAHGALLMDMNGEKVFAWLSRGGPWQHAELLPNGDVLALVKDQRLLRLDRNSRELWTYRARFHHDLDVDDQGNIWTLVRRGRVLPWVHPTIESLVDVVMVFDPEGHVLREIDVLGLLKASAHRYLLPVVSHLRSLDQAGGQLDLLHTNHIEVFDGHLAAKNRLFARGNILLSLRNINAVVIIDGESLQILWLWGPSNLTYQHHPTLLENGNILIFDNGTEHSRVLELNPDSQQIVWSYAPRENFFSRTRGSSQRLPNGNTLITESNRGYVFEVTPGGQKTWVYANPDVNADHERAAIWRMTRFVSAELPFLAESE